ncbi:MAG: 50S ribosomal protein L3 [Chromatiales bacterium]
MALGIIGQKCGMTRIYNEEGTAIPVTVIAAEANRITQVKTLERDGYRAIQVTKGSQKRNRISKALAGIYKKAGVESGQGLWEFRLGASEGEALKVGQEVKVDVFKAGDMVDVSGATQGKGFAGTIKRHHFRSGDATHGNSLAHRTPGSTGQRQTPGRVFKGKHMPGHLGNVSRTVSNLEVVRVDAERNLLLVKGAVPGARGGHLVVRPAVKGR